MYSTYLNSERSEPSTYLYMYVCMFVCIEPLTCLSQTYQVRVFVPTQSFSNLAKGRIVVRITRVSTKGEFVRVSMEGGGRLTTYVPT
jgi:hypothetical protein